MYFNDLLFLNEADDDEEKKKNEDKEEKDDKKEDKNKEDSDKKEAKKSDDSSKEDDSEYNDLMNNVDSSDDFSDSEDFTDDSDDDLSSDSDEDDSNSEYNTLIVVDKSGDSSDGCCGVFEKAAKVGYAYTIIANNMKHIHLAACGDKFNEVHNKTENLYHHFSYAADNYFELALESPVTKLDNPTRAKEHCEDIPVEQSSEYGFEQAMETISSNIQFAITYIEELRKSADSRTDVQSTADEELRYLNKEKNFIIRNSLKSPSMSSDVAMESYNWLF